MKKLIDAAALTGYAPLFYTFGGSKKATDPDYNQTRGIAWSYVTDPDGAKKLVDRILSDCQQTGVKRVILHNPFGKTQATGFMELDQFIAAQEGIDSGAVLASFQHFLDDCAREFMRLTVAGIEVIWYFGTTENDPDFDESKVDVAEYCYRFIESMKPALESGGSICFDSASDALVDSWRYKCMKLIRRLVEAYGGKCYLEPRPRLGFTHLYDWNVISVANFAWRSNSALFGDANGAPDNLLTGEFIVFCDGNKYGGTMYDDAGQKIPGSVAPSWDNTPLWYEDEMRRCRRAGYTPTAHMKHPRIGDPDQPDTLPPAGGVVEPPAGDDGKPSDAQVTEYKALASAADHIAASLSELQSAKIPTTTEQQTGLKAFLLPITTRRNALYETVKDRLPAGG